MINELGWRKNGNIKTGKKIQKQQTCDLEC